MKGAALNGSADRSVLDITKSSRLFTPDMPKNRERERERQRDR